MKIKLIPGLHKVERPAGQWIDGRFVITKHRASGRLAQLSKVKHKRKDSEAVMAWKESENRRG